MDDYFGNSVGGSARPSAPTWGSQPPPAPPAPSYGGSYGGSTAQLPYAVSAPAYPTYPPPQAFPTAYRPAPPGRSTGMKVLLGLAIALGGFVVLSILAAVAIPTFLDQGERGLVAKTTVSIPEAVGGTPRMYGGLATQIEQDLTSLPGPGQHLAGVYGTGAVPSFAVTVAKAHMSASGRRAFMAGAQRDGGVGLVKVDPGALGGEMRCGPATEGSTVCVFVDPAAYGAIAVFGGTDPAGTARAIRAAVEHRAA
jgi:hypothetical protein